MTAPVPTPTVQPAQTATTSLLPEVVNTGVPVSLVRGPRRLEGEVYLTGGYAERIRIETAGVPFDRVAQVADVWQPPRLKGITVASDHGEPFLATNQVFDLRPAPRKWLAASKVPKRNRRYVEPGWVLITCSGNGVASNVGKVTASYKAHTEKLISHDLLRLQAKDAGDFGYLYAFLRSRFGRAMLRSNQYGGVIKHLEPEHAEGLPVPDVSADVRRVLHAHITEVFRLRDTAFVAIKRAEDRFTSEIGGPPLQEEIETFGISAAAIMHGRRRFDAYHHNPSAVAIHRLLTTRGRRVDPLRKLVAKIFGVPRFKHIYTRAGVAYLDSEDIFKINPDITKFIPKVSEKAALTYYVKRDWLLMACSGQLHGINGRVVLAGPQHENKVLSNHVIRIVPDPARDDVRPGYLMMALGHPIFGRPLVLRLAFGSGVPEIAPEDLKDFPVVRMSDTAEAAISEDVTLARDLWAFADATENAAVAALEAYLDDFLAHRPSELGIVATDVPPAISRATRAIRLGDHPVCVQLEIERWSYGVTVARIEGTAIYGEGPDIDAAVADLAENARLFVFHTRDVLALGVSLGGVVRRDWVALRRLMDNE